MGGRFFREDGEGFILRKETVLAALAPCPVGPTKRLH